MRRQEHVCSYHQDDGNAAPTMLEDNAFWNLGDLTAVTKARWTLVQAVKTWQTGFPSCEEDRVADLSGLSEGEAGSGFCRDFGRLLHGAWQQRSMRMPEGGRCKQLMPASLSRFRLRLPPGCPCPCAQTASISFQIIQIHSNPGQPPKERTALLC